MMQTLIRWRLKEIMARHNIKGKDLAQKLDISANAMSSLRKAKTMPRLDGMALNLMCNALNELAEDLDRYITPGDLLDYSQDPINPPDTDKVFSLVKRRRAKKNKLSKDSDPESSTIGVIV
ncbi:MAG: helix-turn-helix transcriptional regulator [Cyanomargarita calcarea GSE-NOS-MK-12-04C]|jgi:DNA-binding Xre family transcriptional regulator|uniref:Helix-turn-helix transcriptional regulator n=1 Tax=Cyanomargarita calcarea GSE-NOS-MK-12-04C TaxID=2839659 RepID=A0A951QQE0_9CYAN|nr:helix-turn-helix transcriptional regulator [Cyanomargarita calcarea GSE-NOS-MK-12-04C]